jgi:hypothetical protein
MRLYTSLLDTIKKGIKKGAGYIFTGCGTGLVCAARRCRKQFGKGSNLPLPL